MEQASLQIMNDASIKTHVRKYYTDLFQRRSGHRAAGLPIATGKDLAELLGYCPEVLSFVPEKYWDDFLPCGNPLAHIEAVPGDRILNLGCGVGVDTLSLLMAKGSSVQIVSLDVVFGAVQKASALMSCCRTPGSELPARASCVCADAEVLPFQPNSFNSIIMNGVFNLFPDKISLLEEINRVLKPDGSLVVADLCCAVSLPDYFHEEWDSWAWCMNGACTEEDLMDLLRKARFEKIRLVREEEKDMLYRVIFSCRKS